MLKQMLTQPGAAHRPVGPHRVTLLLPHRIGRAPDVGVVMDGPPPHAVEVAGDLRAVHGSILDEAYQRGRKVAHRERLGRPVIHLEVNVGSIVGAPGGEPVGTPDALEVDGGAVGARTAYQQVAPETEIHHLQARICRTLCIAGETTVRGHLVKLGVDSGEIQLHPVGN